MYYIGSPNSLGGLGSVVTEVIFIFIFGQKESKGS